MIITAAAFLLSLLLGLVLVEYAWAGIPLHFYLLPIKLSLGAGVGAGISSTIYFLYILFTGSNPKDYSFLIPEGALLIILASLLTKSSIHFDRKILEIPKFRASWKLWLMTALFAISFYYAAIQFCNISTIFPFGDWDGWSIWNLHAKFLVFAKENWKNILSPAMNFSHGDYPLLTPSFIARGWATTQSERTAIPVYTAALFTTAVLGLLSAGLFTLRGTKAALMGGLVLVSTPKFIYWGAAQYADVPLGYFFLAVVMLIALFDLKYPRQKQLLFLAGLCASFGLWTKNEGWLLLSGIVVSRTAAQLWNKQLHASLLEWAYFLTGLAPLFFMTIYYKSIAPINDMVISPLKSLSQLVDISRYMIVLKSFSQNLLSFGNWNWISIPILLFIYFLIWGSRVTKVERLPVGRLVGAIIIILIEYFFTYMLTPRELEWHLKTSLDRLLLQIYPTAIFLFFLAVRTSEKNSHKLSISP
jgi:hypothetical protein